MPKVLILMANIKTKLLRQSKRAEDVFESKPKYAYKITDFFANRTLLPKIYRTQVR